MRVLFVSNLFPPVARGGYEQWCDEIAAALTERGHTVAVLTARASQPSPADASRPFAVYRLLHTEVAGGMLGTTLRLLRKRRYDEESMAITRNLVADFRPDVALIWGMWNISRAVPHEIEQLLGSHVGYYLCDYWLSLPSAYVQRLQEPARRSYSPWYKSLVARYFLPRLQAMQSVPLRLEHPFCVSRAVRELLVTRGVAVAHAKVVYGGTRADEFEDLAPQLHAPGDPLHLLYIGRLESLKGVHTIVRAMQLLPGSAPVTLNIVGTGPSDYVNEVKGLIVRGELQDRVRLMGAVPRSQIPSVLLRHDVLLFPSEWEEPFARSVLEAMLAGLAVIGTTTGGTGEILREGETGLTFPAGDAECLASQIQRIVDDPALRRRLGDAGRQTVRLQFTLERMADELEADLYAIAQPVSIAF
jgi:glycosyltransferase involved in cell wall biosynthesis